MKLPVLLLALGLQTFSVFAQIPFDGAGRNDAPDYALSENWSALPFRADEADVFPEGELPVSDSIKPIDVFYIYPTIYTHGKSWNASLSDQKLNKRIDRFPVKYQAGVFSNTARIYAPRYRQAHLRSFYQLDGTGKTALEFAYQDVKRAFEYYLKHYNQGRPFILAGHSQGTWHARKLLAEEIDSKPIRNQLVAAYVVGFALDSMLYTHVKICDSASQTNCYVGWASFGKGYDAGKSMLVGNVCVNPLSWKRDAAWTVQSEKQAGILLNPDHPLKPGQVENRGNYLWVKHHTPFFRHKKVLHLLDYNLFWYSIRNNAAIRSEAYGEKQQRRTTATH